MSLLHKYVLYDWLLLKLKFICKLEFEILSNFHILHLMDPNSETEQIYIKSEFPSPADEIDEQVSYQFIIVRKCTGYVRKMDGELNEQQTLIVACVIF